MIFILSKLNLFGSRKEILVWFCLKKIVCAAKTEVDSECVSPDFTSAPVKDIFKKMVRKIYKKIEAAI